MTREEMLACLNDRPCSVCKFHTESGCEQWSCVFEEEPEEEKAVIEWCKARNYKIVDSALLEDLLRRN